MGDLLRFSALLRGESNLLVFISSVMTDDLKCARETAVTYPPCIAFCPSLGVRIHAGEFRNAV